MNENKLVRIELRLEESLLQQIDSLRNVHGSSRSEWVRRACRHVIRLKRYKEEAERLRNLGVSREIMEKIDNTIEYLE